MVHFGFVLVSDSPCGEIGWFAGAGLVGGRETSPHPATGGCVLESPANAAAPAERARLFPAESAHQVDDDRDQNNETHASTTNRGASKIKAAAAEQEKKDNDQNDEVHPRNLDDPPAGKYGAFTYVATGKHPASSEEGARNPEFHLESWKSGTEV